MKLIKYLIWILPGIIIFLFFIFNSEKETVILKPSVINIILNNEKVVNKNEIDNYFFKLSNYLDENNYKVSIGYYNFSYDYTYKYHEEDIYYGASLIKTLDALYVYEKMELTDILKNKVKLAIEKSDNKAHKNLVDIIGFDNLKNYGLELGATNVLALGKEYYGNTAVSDQLVFLKKLYSYINDVTVDVDKRYELRNYFINDYFNYLKFKSSLLIMHKYGYYGIFFHDVGIVLSRLPYIIVVLTKEADNFSLVRDISQKVYEINSLLE